MMYSKRNYKILLQCAIAEGYRFVDYEYFTLQADRQAILRHDIDMSPSIALEMAEIDASCGIRSTFAVLLSAPLYNPFSPENVETINRIHGLGHNIALHHPVLPLRSDKRMQRDIKREMRVMRYFFPYTQPVFIWHSTGGAGGLASLTVPGIINAYSSRFTEQAVYVSDTRLSPEDFLKAIDTHKPLHMLFHPVTWMSERDGAVATLSYAVTRAVRDWDRQSGVKNSAWREKYPNELPEETLAKIEEVLNGND